MAEHQDKRVLFENAEIILLNFAGKEGKYNREGDRNFCLKLDEDIAQQMAADGWTIGRLKAREEGDVEQAILQVSVSYKNRPPKIALITSRGRTDLSEDLVEMLDYADMDSIDLFINPYHWNVNGKTGIKAYLSSMFVTIHEDYLDQKYGDVPYAGHVPTEEPTHGGNPPF